MAATHLAERFRERDPDVASPIGKSVSAPGGRAAAVLAIQRSIGNRAVTRALHRQVRIDGGRKRVDEAHYKTGTGKSVGTKFSVASLIADGVRRVFSDQTELENYANGLTDYIGDVATKSAGTFWYRLPKDQVTVLGEEHHNPDGNVEDVIIGLRTARFMYEPFNELAATTALNIPFTGTQARLDQINKGIRVGGLVDRKRFDPDLENIVIKALTGASITRNEYIAAAPADRADATWKARASRNDYSYGERTALYLSMAIHIAGDVSQHDFGIDNWVESPFVKSGRRLKETYLRHQAELDAFMKAKDKDDLIGIYELTSPAGFANLAGIKELTVAFHEYGSLYIAQLGSQSGSKELEAHGEALRRKPGAKLDAFGPVREAIMWQKIAGAKGYLLVGMGDAHRIALKNKLDKAGIPHEKVDEALVRQRDAVKAVWVP